MEVRNWLIRELQADISVFDILGTIPISALSVKIVETSKLLTEKFKTETQEVSHDHMKEEVVKTENIEIIVEKQDPKVVVLPGSLVTSAVEMLKSDIVEAVDELSDASSSEDTPFTVEVIA